MWFFTSLLAALGFGIASLTFKGSSLQSFHKNSFCLVFFSCATISFLVNFLLKGGEFSSISLNTIIFGSIAGFITYFGNSCFYNAMRSGSAGLTAIAVNFNVVIGFLYFTLILGETLTTNNIIFISLLTIALCLIPIDKNKELKIDNKFWYLFVIGTCICFGSRNSLLKYTLTQNMDNNEVLLVAYIVATFFYLIGMILNKEEFKLNKGMLKLGSFGGLAHFTGIFMYSYSLGLTEGTSGVKASLVLSVFSLSNVFALIGAILIFKEKFSRNQKISLTMILIAIFIFK